MNNIFLPNDPLLYNQQSLNDYRQLYEQKLMRDREQLDKQYNEYLALLLKNQPVTEDKLSLLNSSLKNLSPALKETLLNNQEFVSLNQELQNTVQEELVLLVRQNINSNPAMSANIDKQIKIINEIENSAKEQDRKSMDEINDYIKNYSNMTFAEYKKLKSVN